MISKYGPWGVFTAVCFAIAFSSPVVAHAAEPEYAEPTEQQLELNDQALSQMNDGEYAKAASLMQESLHIAPLNITYLNLGRSYQKMDRCVDARASLEKVESAPKVRSPAPDFVEKKAREYLAEIRDAGCAEAPTGTALEGARANRRATVGWASLGAGAALLGVGVIFELQAAGLRDDIRTADADGDGIADSMTREAALDKRSQANTFSTLALATVVGGAISAGVGGYLLSTDSSKQTSRVGLHIGPGGSRVVWSLRF